MTKPLQTLPTSHSGMFLTYLYTPSHTNHLLTLIHGLPKAGTVPKIDLSSPNKTDFLINLGG